MNKKDKWVDILTLSLTIAALPPIWAVASNYIGVTVGAVALICAGLYVAAGNTIKKAVPITIGFLCGDLWSYVAVNIMARSSLNPDVTLYCTLFVLGGLAVIIGSALEKWIFVPAWLCGWAIGLTIIGPMDVNALGTMPLQIGVAMVAGVWYVGVVGDLFQRFLVRLVSKNK